MPEIVRDASLKRFTLVLVSGFLIVMEKKLYYQLSDGGDYSGVTMKLSGIMAWIEGDQDNCKETDDMPEYTITPIWMTEEEFENLPEA